MNKLAPEFHPTLEYFNFDISHIVDVHDELSRRARRDPSQMYGYFPQYPGIDHNLPASIAFAEAYPSIAVDNLELGFSFVKLSLIKQPHRAPYHRDGDSKSGLAPNAMNVNGKAIRVLLNFSEDRARDLKFLDIEPDGAEPHHEPGYITINGEHHFGIEKSLPIPPRDGSRVAGAFFVANRVYHVGAERASGSFLGSYGVDIGSDP